MEIIYNVTNLMEYTEYIIKVKLMFIVELSIIEWIN